MKKKSVVFKFADSEKEFLFEDKVFVIEDKSLVEVLCKPSIKNPGSNLLIKSLNDTNISDVVQIKVNMNETGYFLFSFTKDSLDETKRKSLLEEIGGLKSNAAQTNSTQLKKTLKLIEIVKKYKPIYASLVNDGIYKINISKLSQTELNFPILVLNKPSKKLVFKPKKRAKKSKNGDIKPQKTYDAFPLFGLDHAFVLLFTLLGSFGVITSIFEFMNKESIAIFLVILAVAFAFILVLSVQSTLYKKTKLINPFFRYYLIIFIIIGVAGGIVSGYFVSKLVLKTEIEDFDYKKLIILSSTISLPIMLSSLSTSRVANLIIKKRKEKKN